jgi:hypothetical protein
MFAESTSFRPQPSVTMATVGGRAESGITISYEHDCRRLTVVLPNLAGLVI